MFEIVIREITEVKTKKTEWVRMTAADDSPYGYAPPIEVTGKESVTRYEQRLNDIDLVAVIKAINDIDED